MIYKAQTKHKISDNALTLIQSQIGILKEEIEKTNTYCTKFKDNIKRQAKAFMKEMKMKFYTKESICTKWEIAV